MTDPTIEELTAAAVAYRSAAAGRLEGLKKLGAKLRAERAENRRLTRLLLDLDRKIQRLERELRVAWALAEGEIRKDT